MQKIQPTQRIEPKNRLTQTFKFPRGYFPIKYRLAGFDYKDLVDFTNLGSNYFEKPFTQELIDFVLLDGYGNTDTLKTYYGITVTAGNATPNGAGTGISVDAPMLGAMSVWLKARYGGEGANFDMTLRVLVADLMKDANANYSYPSSGILDAIREAAQKLKEFALITKSDPVRVKSIKFSDVGGNSRKQYEENMIYFQTDSDTEIKQKIKPSLARSSTDKNTQIVTIIPSKPMILDGLRDLDVSVIGNESFLTTFLQERENAIQRIKNFLNASSPLIFFDATALGRFNRPLILPFTAAPVLNLQNGVDITLIFEKVRPDFVLAPVRTRMLAPAVMPVPTLAPVVTPVQAEQTEINAFDEDTTEIAPKSNIVAIVVVIVVLLVGIVIVGES